MPKKKAAVSHQKPRLVGALAAGKRPSMARWASRDFPRGSLLAIREEPQILGTAAQDQGMGGDRGHGQEYGEHDECLTPSQLLDERGRHRQEDGAGEASDKGEEEQGAPTVAVKPRGNDGETTS